MSLQSRIVGALLLIGLPSLAVAAPGDASADAQAPWGRGSLHEVDYAPSKVVYDVSVGDLQTFQRVLDRASYLNNIYHADPFGTSIVLVLHGDEIPFFAIENYGKYEDLMIRAHSLTVGGTIKFRMCRVAAKDHGYDPEDIHGFVEIVPMADAEIVRLQREEGYAYMQ
ncbi:MAG: DsrE family protein [Chromatiales bacterium]|jgi:intracellular sulfur oxidation DsrE/DsrF family protein